MAKLNDREDPSRDVGLLIRRLVVFALPALVLVGFVGLNILTGIFAPKVEEKEEAIKATPVVVAEATTQSVTLSVITQGEATPRRQINLASNVSGRIAGVSPQFIQGGAFKKDDILIEIEDEEFRYRVTQARASVAQAESRFASEQAEAVNAQIEFADLGQGEASALTLRKPQMAEAAAMLASAKASLGEALLQLERTKIRAPFDGRITDKMVDIGDFVTPGTPLGRAFSSDVMEVRLPLTDNEMGQLGLPIGYMTEDPSAGAKVTLRANVGGYPRSWVGNIVRTESSFDPQTRVLFAYVAVEDPYDTGADNGVPLAAGLFVTAEIEGRIINNAVLVPRTAVRGDGQVFVARDDATLEIRDVAIAKSDPGGAVLTAGLVAGERVITSPVKAPATGMAIAVAGDDVASDDTAGDADDEEQALAAKAVH